jgi:hypothetical protein
VKHLALRTRSSHSDKPFTAAGLGDRIHSITLAWAYGQGEPVTLHLSPQHLAGGQFGNKPESWAEIVALFPAGMIALSLDPCEVTYRYGDHPGPQEPAGFDIAPYLKRIPLLADGPRDHYFTAQWDAGGPGRRVRRPDIPNTVIVGGKATGDMRWSLKAIGEVMARAEGHVGVDSAFFHLAQLYMSPERITLYHGAKVSHHVRRARDNGVVCVRL